LFAVVPPIPSDRLTRPHQAAFPAALYLILAAADLIFSLVAFNLGVPEGNPFMAWLLARGLFVPGKIGISLLIVLLMLAVYGGTHRWRWLAWGAVGIMMPVVGFHLWALPLLMRQAILIPLH
jgi:hypothetical protein